MTANLVRLASDDPHRFNKLPANGHFTFDTYPEPNSFGNREGSYPGVKEVVYSPEEVLVPSFLPDNKATRAELAQYYQAVSRLDQGVGRLIQILKEAGQYENTLIIYLSDNRVAFPGAKTTLYDPGMKLPLLVRLPGGKGKGKTQDALVSWVDIMPTVLDYAGVAQLRGTQGRSFRNVLEDPKAQGQTYVFASHSLHEITMFYPMRVIRNRQYKLIYNIASGLPFPFARDLIESSAWQSVQEAGSSIYGKRSIEAFVHRPAFELYDLGKDPDETHNLAQQAQYKEVLDNLLESLKQFQKSTNDPWYHKWSYE